MFKSSASKAVRKESIDQAVLKELMKYPVLLESLDKWTLFADRKLIPNIQKLGELVKEIKPISEQPIYRGFGNFSVQEFLGFDTRNAKVGDKREVKYLDRAISFTIDLEIAKAFGPIVARCTDWKKHNYLYVCPELCAVISQRRNIKAVETQEEIILLPPLDIHCEIVDVKKRSIFNW